MTVPAASKEISWVLTRVWSQSMKICLMPASSWLCEEESMVIDVGICVSVLCGKYVSRAFVCRD